MHELSFKHTYSCFFGEMPVCFCFDTLKLLLVKFLFLHICNVFTNCIIVYNTQETKWICTATFYFSNINTSLSCLYRKMFSLVLKTFLVCEQNLSSSCGPRGPRLDNSSRGDRRLDKHPNLILLANSFS